MIRTLRITSVIAVVLAAVFFVLPAIFGVRGDEQIEQFLNSAGAIEKFNDARGDRIDNSRHEISPLVKQAEAFALYLNPPPASKPSSSESRLSRSKPRPRRPVSPKFKLVGTSYYVLHPEQSLALIDEPGKGLRWVKQSSEVGHLVIEQVKDGLVVVRDGQSTFEIVAERTERRSLLKKGSSVLIGGEKETVLNQEAKEAARQETLAELDAMLLELGLTPDGEPVETAPETKTEKIAAPGKNQRISGRENMRISSEEAKRLGRLGRRLRDVQKVSTRIEVDNTEGDANLGEPNLGDVNNMGR